MSSKRFQILAAVTVVACAGAIVAVNATRSPGVPGKLGLALPDLAENLNNVSTVQIKRSTGSVTLARQGVGDKTQWTVPAKSGYPVDVGKLRALLLQLKDFELAEAKTSNPELFAKLGVQDVKLLGKDGAVSDATPGALIELKDDSRKQIGALIIGNSASIGNATLDRPMETGQFVRRPGAMQSWLSKGTIYLDADPMNWVDRKVAGIDRERVKSATVRRLVGNGPELQGELGKPDLFISRASAEEPAFQTDPVPEGRTQKPNESFDQPVTAIAFLNMEDVIRDPGGVIGTPDSSATGENAARPAVAQFATFDGLLLTVKTGFHDGRWWAAVQAESTADAIPPGESKATVVPVAAAAKEADEINLRTNGWLFGISQFDAKRLSAKFDEMFAAPPAPTPAAPAVGPAAVPPPESETGSPLPPAPR